jgi:hypothetical protein
MGPSLMSPHPNSDCLARRNSLAPDIAQLFEHPRRRSRRGATILELVATCILLGVVFSVSVPLLTVVARERRSAGQRQFAMQHAGNLLERTVARGWSNLSAGPQVIAPADSELESLLPGLEQRAEVRSLGEELDTKLVTVSIRWRNRAGQLIAPVQLSAWVHPTMEVPR